MFSTHKLNQKERGFLDQIKQTIHFRCGDTLISEDQEYQALKDKKVCVDRRKTCSMPLETQIYTLKKQTICVACGSVLSPEILSKFEEVKTEFSTVLPNCGVEACLKFMEFWWKGPIKGKKAK